MERAERETIININVADLDEGFFQFGTSEKTHYQRLVRRVGLDNLISVRETKNAAGKVEWWQARVPARFLDRSLGIRTERQVKAFQRQKPPEARADSHQAEPA